MVALFHSFRKFLLFFLTFPLFLILYFPLYFLFSLYFISPYISSFPCITSFFHFLFSSFSLFFFFTLSLPYILFKLCIPDLRGEAYRDRRLTTNFELWIEIFCVPTCFHVRIPKPCLSVCPSVCLSAPRE